MVRKDVRTTWVHLQQSKGGWRRQVLPGLSVIGVVLLARLLGLFQGLEWKTLDRFLRWRPMERGEERVLIIGIDEADIQGVGTYPIPDEALGALLERVSEAGARVIGLDIFRDLPVEPGHEGLAEILAATPSIVGIEKITEAPIPPAPALPPERVGFYEFPLDEDGFVRRAYLGVSPLALGVEPSRIADPDRFRFSLALKLAEAYLAEENLVLENGVHNPANMRFGETELFQFQPNAGGYVGTPSAGVQLVINPRSGESPFQIVSMLDVMEGRVATDRIRDRIILIGMMASSVKDLVSSGAVNAPNPGRVYGVEMHAHITSQILSAVLDHRPLLRVWEDGWEYLWIALWGGIGMLLVRYVPRPSWYMLSIGVMGLGLVGTSLALLWIGGWWIPVIPTLIGFSLNGWVLPGFYLYDQTLRARIQERQRVIEQTYDAIHNGPLQTLALLRHQPDPLPPRASDKLATLNQELRAIYTRLLQESLPEEEQLQLGSEYVADLRNPLNEVLYEVYAATLKRGFPGFESIRVKVITFEPMRVARLAPAERRSLCRFLEEALCNVGRHAIRPTRLKVQCQATETENLIRVEDNGHVEAVSEVAPGGRGTEQAKALAHRLRGKFQRASGPTGTSCELRWPLRGAKG